MGKTGAENCVMQVSCGRDKEGRNFETYENAYRSGNDHLVADPPRRVGICLEEVGQPESDNDQGPSCIEHRHISLEPLDGDAADHGKR